ncbi:MAG: carboxylating nicotinate-nucleotide diphosphorylase [Thaumarchaeota archaeon]|nr:carboxylating nicotinate-nucleotide diphosphorylase [Candidatus Terraquivivens yellowstonensis]MCL7401036.1 carboxylating nicotinate-nucleotide diphosphorylase [Candidatus Terraquivivens yellowstonensis]
MVQEVVFRKFLSFLEEDVPFRDVTTDALIPEDVVVRAHVVAKQSCVVACIDDIVYFLERLGLHVKELVKDGAEVEKGAVLLELVGPARVVLGVERLMLNILMHCSGIATEVRKLVRLVRKVNSKIRVAATRKTLPGLRYFEKKAVLVGGGDVHRYSLSDAILIKDNHIKIIGSVEKALEVVKNKASFVQKVEVETSTIEEAIKAAESGVDIIMLDNMKSEEVAKVVEELKRRGLREKVLIEVSGGITSENILEYAKLDVDIISCGYITMSSRASDMSLEVVEVIKK